LLAAPSSSLFISASAFCSAGLLAAAFVPSLEGTGSKWDSSEWPGADGAGFGVE
jgi:hypothetical protein